MRFTKMHGIGNDYVYIDGFDPRNRVEDPAALARAIADRHFGVGADGLIFVLPPHPPRQAAAPSRAPAALDEGQAAHVRMRMFNADGSEAEMCGNGVRCVCKFAHDHPPAPGLDEANPMRVRTGRGVLELHYTLDAAGAVDQVTVDMGEPILEPRRVPVAPDQLTPTPQPQTFHVSLPPHISPPPGGDSGGGDGGGSSKQQRLIATFVSMGNPHAVIYVDDAAAIDLPTLGRALENLPAFPRRMNVHFVQVHDAQQVTVRHWERGSGATLACGTGACAVCVAGVLTGRTARRITAHLPGGDLQLQWRENTPPPHAAPDGAVDAGKPGHVLMTGPAVEVFTGEWADTLPDT